MLAPIAEGGAESVLDSDRAVGMRSPHFELQGARRGRRKEPMMTSEPRAGRDFSPARMVEIGDGGMKLKRQTCNLSVSFNHAIIALHSNEITRC
jgi:hypothetical protein